MENALTREQLNNLDKETLVEMVIGLTSQVELLNQKMEKMLEQLAIANTNRFARKSESGLSIDENQVSIFNEIEAFADDSEEPSIDVIIPSYKRRKHVGKRDEDLSGFPVKIIEHNLSEEDLSKEFPSGFNRLPDEVYKKLEVHPATYEVLEHHIAVYKDKTSGKILKAEHPVEMLNNSIATPSLVAGIINGKYTNSMPLYRIEQEFERNDVHISRQVMSNWVITLTERYLSLVYDRLKKEILKNPVIHADETPVMVTKDGRDGMHKNYMWVYRTGTMCKANPSIVYDYQKTRRMDHPKEFLNGFDGKLVCDGYQVYHSLEDDSGFTVAGCWVHARRPFAEVCKSLGKENAINTLAYEILVQMDSIFHEDNALDKLPPSERKKRRKLIIKPMVDNFFVWIKAHQFDVAPGSKTANGINYCLNQEKYLRVFLEDPKVPMDNNAAERAIRNFCVGKKNWKLIDTVKGAEASAMLYSIVETAKENNLKPYEYFKHLLTEIPKHMDDTNLNFIEEMLPWSKNLPEVCKKTTVDKK